MKHYRCKCGHRKGWGTEPFADCKTCERCGSTLASHPDFHHEPIEHDWETETITNSGSTRTRTYCRRCFELKKDTE